MPGYIYGLLIASIYIFCIALCSYISSLIPVDFVAGPFCLICSRLNMQVEQLEQEIAELQQALSDKREQEAQMIQVQF